MNLLTLLQVSLYLGQERGGITDDLIEVQIKNTIKKHLDKELQLKDKGIKVLSLFFVDKVANYRIYDAEGKPAQGKYAELFEHHYNELIKLPQYQELAIFPVDKLHDGYFSADKKGVLKRHQRKHSRQMMIPTLKSCVTRSNYFQRMSH
jgi:type III restriction enzyme